MLCFCYKIGIEQPIQISDIETPTNIKKAAARVPVVNGKPSVPTEAR